MNVEGTLHDSTFLVGYSIFGFKNFKYECLKPFLPYELTAWADSIGLGSSVTVAPNMLKGEFRALLPVS